MHTEALVHAVLNALCQRQQFTAPRAAVVDQHQCVLGMHACIGQDLAAGLDPLASGGGEDHLFGLVPVAVRAVLDAGGRPDPSEPPSLDPESARGYWGRYPVTFPT